MVHSEYRLDRTVEVVAADGLQLDNFEQLMVAFMVDFDRKLEKSANFKPKVPLSPLAFYISLKNDLYTTVISAK